jgi:hypothetical protein
MAAAVPALRHYRRPGARDVPSVEKTGRATLRYLLLVMDVRRLPFALTARRATHPAPAFPRRPAPRPPGGGPGSPC